MISIYEQLCFFDRMTGLKALRRLCRCGGKDFLQPIPLCHLCTTQAFSIGQLELLLILFLALPTGGHCTVSAVNAAAAHHPRLDRAQIMSAFLEQVLTAFIHVQRWKSPTNYIPGSSTTSFDLPVLITDLLPDLSEAFSPSSTSSHLSEELEPSSSQRLDMP